MKKKELKEWVSRPLPELEKEIFALSVKRTNLAFQAADGKTSTASGIREIKKSIAQLKTVVVQKKNGRQKIKI